VTSLVAMLDVLQERSLFHWIFLETVYFQEAQRQEAFSTCTRWANKEWFLTVR